MSAIRQNPAYYGGQDKGNYTKGREGAKIDKIIVHHAATTSFDGIAATFQRPGRRASAHYGVGRNGAIDQYVQEGDIAWHCGNWAANKTSIGIENVNSSGAPAWDIAEDTFNTLVDLIRDIATRNGLMPVKVGVNLFGHKQFMATACPGQLYDRLHEIARLVNGGSGGSVTPTPPPTTPPRKSNEVIAAEVLAGAWGNNPERRQRLEAAGYNYNYIQLIVNAKSSNASAPVPKRASSSEIADQVIAGAWGNGPDRKRRIEAAGYNFQEVQSIVNVKLGAPVKAPSRKSNDQIANEVIAGQWGNNPERKNKLKSAGYDPAQIQSIVNRKLGF